jgi:hypothetical protein
MSKVLGSAGVKRGAHSIERSADDLFDKIINLKFVRRSGASFSLRSDYEPVFHSDNSVSFRRCVQKPHIKLTYKQVAENVAVEVNIEVTNFFSDYTGANGLGSRIDAYDGDPVEWCVVQMGYGRQFPDWTSTQRKGNLDQFYDLNNNGLTTEAEVARGNQILVQILSSYTTAFPPDMVTYFQGIVGTFEAGLRWNHTEADLVEDYGDPDYKSSFPDGLSEIEQVLFQFISRRFIKPSVLHLVQEEAVNGEITQKVQIYGYKDYAQSRGPALSFKTAESVTTENVMAVTAAARDQAAWDELSLTAQGIMSVEDAQQFGVTCLTTKRLRDAASNFLYRYDVAAADTDTLRPVRQTPFDGAQNAVGAQLAEIQRQYSFIRWYVLRDGTYFVYHKDDTDEDLFNDPVIKAAQRSDLVLLPAIYDMTVGGTRTIRCPFISFISPTTTVVFSSRYSLGSMPGFYYHPKPKNGLNAYVVLLANIEFDTTGDANMMELTCVDIRDDQTPELLSDGTVVIRDADGSTVLASSAAPETRPWIEKEMVVGKYPHARGISRWVDIAETFLLSAVSDDDWPDGLPDVQRAVADLKTWNENGIWNDDHMVNDEGTSPENRLAVKFDFPIPWMYEGETVKYRTPYLPVYKEDAP